MINYAHRGASEYAPENTLSAFYLGLLQGANGIETDIQMTRDGVLVLYHDETLDNKTNGTGRIYDHTLEELKQLRIYGQSTTGFYDRITTFREFLEHFSQYDIHFAIEVGKLDPPVEKETLAMIKEFDIMKKVTFTSFRFECIKKIKEMDKNARVGYLTSETSDEVTARLLSIGGEEIAPKAETITPELMTKWRSAGLGVRAWGVTSIMKMKRMCQFGVDGMTVNFPDRLFEYLNACR